MSKIAIFLLILLVFFIISVPIRLVSSIQNHFWKDAISGVFTLAIVLIVAIGVILYSIWRWFSKKAEEISDKYDEWKLNKGGKK